VFAWSNRRRSGRLEEALRKGRRAVELLPVEKDPVNGMIMIEYLAMTAAGVGEKDLACEQLATAVRLPVSGVDLSYGELKLMPWWDALRDEPCFEKIVGSLAPKEFRSGRACPERSRMGVPPASLASTSKQPTRLRRGNHGCLYRFGS